ncbi:hypothetical protein PAXRUDRAFT_832393 [Paxillus rubicundulus Ve08.2h10]|uniref:Uncharacterized protein n=1 Tax=Paxillus rubicundulus Ve08.2h10 TaxID=930991 RepID=A0A0D0DKA3_9AGAM|nr:hypothetical protein PAXRUDRAFT_832393 [Paxillus rubicundulus Ve08.2h10]
MAERMALCAQLLCDATFRYLLKRNFALLVVTTATLSHAFQILTQATPHNHCQPQFSIFFVRIIARTLSG